MRSHSKKNEIIKSDQYENEIEPVKLSELSNKQNPDNKLSDSMADVKNKAASSTNATVDLGMIKGEEKLDQARPSKSSHDRFSPQINTVQAAANKNTNVKAENKVINGVYKGEITVEDWEIVSKLIKDKIVEVGGTKAGEVELGWIKNKTTSYYHFVFPADKLETLLSFFKKYGEISYKFEPHPRKLPEGQKRFILEVHQSE